MKSGFVIDGGSQLQAKLETLGRTVQKRVVRQAVRAAQKPPQRQAHTNARGRVGGKMGALLARHIVIKKPRRQVPGTYALHVQMRADVAGFVHIAKKGGRRSYIPAAIEYGHGSSKESAARPFMRAAARRTRGESIRILGKELAHGILREAIKGRYAG